MNKLLQTILLLPVISLFGLVPVHAAAAISLSKSEIEHGEFFDIFGSAFGSGSSEYSFVCFGSTNNCVRGVQIVAQPPLSWSDTQIHLQLPTSGIPISGEIIVVAEGVRTTCTQAGSCITEKFHEDRGRAQYKIKPTISGVLPKSAAKPGQQITILGNGFGENQGDVIFEDRSARIVRWGYTSIDVITPESITKNTKQLTVKSINGLSTTAQHIVSAPFTNDELSYQQYYLQQIGVPALWKEKPRKEVVVAVLDDGVYANHPDLKGKIWQNFKEIPGNGKDDDANGFVDDYLGYNFLDATAAVDPKGGHGTFVAGIIGAVRDNSIGIAGIAESVKIMPVIISDGKTSNSEILTKGMQYAIDNGADIINISFASIGSLGFFQKNNDIYQQAFDKGVIVVVAAGNKDIHGGIGQNLNLIPESPVCNNDKMRIMLGVAALDNTDATSDGRKKAPWASYGSNCVTVSAPGTAIASTIPPIFQSEKKFYDVLDGSSFSAPIISGVAAQIKSLHPELKHWEIMNRIHATAETVDQWNSDFTGQLGGRVNADRALNASMIQPNDIAVSPSTVHAGEKVTLTMNGYLDSDALRITNKGSLDMALPDSSIRVRGSDTFLVTIPSSLPVGTYFIRVISKAGAELAVLSEPLNILAPLPPSLLSLTPTTVVTPPTLPAPTTIPQTQVTAPPTQTSTPSLVSSIAKRLNGSILLQVQSNGEAWYIYPGDFLRYYLGRPADAFSIMRRLGLGVTHTFITSNTIYPDRVSGRILLDVEDHGKAYYINPKDKRAYYLGRPADAFEIMRRLGIGITNKDLEIIGVGL